MISVKIRRYSYSLYVLVLHFQSLDSEVSCPRTVPPNVMINLSHCTIITRTTEDTVDRAKCNFNKYGGKIKTYYVDT